jgi:apolipoprotein N-acyltransferase
MRDQGTDLFAVIVNDAWFGDTTFPHQHAGISAPFDSLGRVFGGTEHFREAVLDAPLPILREPTVYHRIGDVPAWIACAGSLALAALAWRAHRRRGNARAVE